MASPLTRYWNSVCSDRRAEIAAEMLESLARDPDRRALLIGDLARVLKVRALTLHRRPNSGLVRDLALHFTRLGRPSIDCAFQALFRPDGDRFRDFNAAIGVGDDAPAVPGSVHRFELKDLEAFGRRHGSDVLELALAVAAELGRPEVRPTAARLFEELEAARRASASPPLIGQSLQEPAASPPTQATESAPAAPSDLVDGAPLGRASAALPPADAASGRDRGQPPQPVPAEGGTSARAGARAAAPQDACAGDRPAQGWGSGEAADEELDRIVIRSIVAHANGEFGAMQAEEIRRLVTSLIALNVGRFRSYFHLGFADALLGGEMQAAESGINQPRRAWYLCGFILGKRRALDDRSLVELLKGLCPTDREALRSPLAIGAREKLGATVFDAARRCGEHAVLADWIRECAAFDEHLADSAAALALTEPSSDAGVNQHLLSACVEVRLSVSARLDDGRVLAPVGELLNALVGCTWEAGGAAAVQALPQLLTANARDPESRWILRLLRLDVQSADDLVPRDAASLERLASAFARVPEAPSDPAVDGGAGREDPSPFPDAAEPIPFAALAGTYAWLHRASRGVGEADVREARRLLSMAKSATVALRQESNRRHRFALLPCAGLVAVISILSDLVACLAGDEPEVKEASRSIDRWIRTRGSLPQELVRQSLENALLSGSPDVASFYGAIVARYGAEAVELADIRFAAGHPAARTAFLSLLEASNALAPDRRWTISQAIGRVAAKGASDTELARRCCDELCDLAERWVGRFAAPLRAELRDPAWSDVFDDEEIDTRLLALAEISGDYSEAGNLLQRRLHRAMASRDLVLARDFVEMLDTRGLGHFVSDEQRRWMDAQQHASGAGQAPPQGKPVRILFVGGNECQSRWAADVAASVARQTHGVGVDFVHPGWSANWGVPLAEVERRIDSCGAVVLMQFVRTILGEKVRRLASERGRPWIACSGHGKASMERAILEAVRVVREAPRRSS